MEACPNDSSYMAVLLEGLPMTSIALRAVSAFSEGYDDGDFHGTI